MSNPDTSPGEVFEDLRRQLFELDAAGVGPGDAGSSDLYGVVMEEGIEGGSYLVFGLRDGSASLYLSTGGGSIGGQGQPAVHAAARRLVAAGQLFLDGADAVDDAPPPALGQVRFSFLTSAGVRAIEVGAAAFEQGTDELLPLFAAAQDVISGFREDQEREPIDESTYLNCLLTAIARGNGRAATVGEFVPLPEPAQFTEDAVDREWIAGMRFDYEALSAEEVVRQLLALTKFRRLGLSSEGRIAVQLAAHDSGALSDALFRVQRKTERGRRTLSIERATPARG